MALIKSEPVASTGASAGAFAIVVAYLVGLAFPTMPIAVQGAVTALVVGPVIATFVAVARRHSFAENTLREAGLDPAAVSRNADDPSIKRCTVGEAGPTLPHRRARHESGGGGT